MNETATVAATVAIVAGLFTAIIGPSWLVGAAGIACAVGGAVILVLVLHG